MARAYQFFPFALDFDEDAFDAEDFDFDDDDLDADAFDFDDDLACTFADDFLCEDLARRGAWTGLFQSTALSARNVDGIAMGPSA
jgi:hypothetical protein